MQRAQRSGEVRAFKKRWGGEEEGADSSLQGRLEASRRDRGMGMRQRGAFKER